MFRKVSNKLLGIIFLILIAVVLFTFIFDTGKNERTFREVLVDIDTTRVTEILIYPKSKNHSEVRLYKENNEWKVSLPGNKSASVLPRRITDLFNQFLAIKPVRLAARGQDKWSEFQVDSTGSRVKVLEGDNVTLDLIIGRFMFQQPRSMSTCIRLANDVDVYVVDGFLEMTFNQGPELFRDGTIISSDVNKWSKLQFIYPSDSSFSLTKSGNDWIVNGIKADSVKTVNYLNQIAHLSGSKYFDNYSPDNLGSPVYHLNITTDDLQFIEVKGFRVNQDYLIISSQNPEAIFDGASVGSTVFISESTLLTR